MPKQKPLSDDVSDNSVGNSLVQKRSVHSHDKLIKKMEKEKNKNKNKNNEIDDEEDWVQCDQCAKWRRLPPRVHPTYPTNLPGSNSWVCAMNTWDINSSCSKPEESFALKEISSEAIKIRIWARRLKAADKYEAKFSRHRGVSSQSMSAFPSVSAIVSGGPGSVDREFGNVDWIRCSNP